MGQGVSLLRPLAQSGTRAESKIAIFDNVTMFMEERLLPLLTPLHHHALLRFIVRHHLAQVHKGIVLSRLDGLHECLEEKLRVGREFLLRDGLYGLIVWRDLLEGPLAGVIVAARFVFVTIMTVAVLVMTVGLMAGKT